MENHTNKFTEFDTAIYKKIEAEQAIKFLNDNELRDLFILEYAYFETDGNDIIYQSFIQELDKNDIENNLEKATACLDLAMTINYYSDKTLEKIFTILETIDLQPEHEELVLSSLDYVLIFYPQISPFKFQQFHQPILTQNLSELIHFQVSMNLLFIDFEENVKNVLKILNDCQEPHFFYRFFQSIENQEQFNKLITNNLNLKIKNLIGTKNFSEEVQEELRSFLS